MFYVYILRDVKTGALYKGYSRNLKKRLLYHSLKLGYTGRGDRDWQLAWYCCFRSEIKALAFEKYLKSASGIAFSRKRFV